MKGGKTCISDFQRGLTALGCCAMTVVLLWVARRVMDAIQVKRERADWSIRGAAAFALGLRELLMDPPQMKGVDPVLREKAVELVRRCQERGIELVITEGKRALSEQSRLYAQGRTAPGRRITWARAGESWHNFGLAVDVAFRWKGKVTWDGPWSTVGELGESLGLEWGGRWEEKKDEPHFQMRGGRTTAQLRLQLGWPDPCDAEE